MSLDLQLEYWNGRGPAKNFSHPVDIAQLQARLQPSSAIIDFGCGYGRILHLLHQHGFQNLLGVDPAPSMVAAARMRVPEAQAEILTNPPSVQRQDATFDAALLVSVLTCVPSDEGQRAIVRELTRLLRPGGYLLISDLWLQTDERNRARYDSGLKTHGIYGVFDLPEGVTVRHHEPAWIHSLTEGFDQVSLEDSTLTTMNGHRAQGFQWMGRKKQT